MIHYFDSILKTISESIHSMDMAQFDRLVDECQSALSRGKKIVVSGLGKNVPVCDKFVGTMNSLGMQASFMNTNSAVHGDLGIIEDGDLVIILTKSGETAESIYLTHWLQERKVDLWLLTFCPDSTLTRQIPNSLVLSLDNEGDAWNIVPNNSTTVNLIVLQGIAITLAERMGVTLHDFKLNHPGGHIGVQLENA